MSLLQSQLPRCCCCFQPYLWSSVQQLSPLLQPGADVCLRERLTFINISTKASTTPKACVRGTTLILFKKKRRSRFYVALLLVKGHSTYFIPVNTFFSAKVFSFSKKLRVRKKWQLLATSCSTERFKRSQC